MRPKFVRIAFVVGLTSCATGAPMTASDALDEAIPLCALLDNADPHIGKTVLVRGLLMRDPEHDQFWSGECKRGFLTVRLSAETAETRKLRSLADSYLARSGPWPQRVSIAYSGILTDHRPGFTCESVCSQFSLQSAEVAAVRPYYGK